MYCCCRERKFLRSGSGGHDPDDIFLESTIGSMPDIEDYASLTGNLSYLQINNL